MNKKTVVFGFLGTQLDSGATEKRWERWRPSVALCGHDALSVDRLELFLCSTAHQELADRIAADIALVSPHTEVISHVLDLPDPWDFPRVYEVLHDFAKSREFSDETDYYVHLTTGTHVAQICLFLLTESRYFPARLVDTYSHKGVAEAWRGRLEVIDLDLARYDLLASRFKQEQEDSEALLKSGIATRNAAFNALISQVEKVCLRSSAPILLTGPTGAGKSQLAGRIYALRARRHQVKGAFVEVNCATLRGDNAMSALFGHKKGAFTGATGDRPGLLKSADGGILFLDEIGELGMDEQAMLLRALEDKRFLPMGSDKESSSDFQLIAGTNKNLAMEVAAGRFRADLYARINLWTFALPGLAERREDIEPNLDYEMERASVNLGLRVSMNDAARQRYLVFAQTAAWPGNFRDLAASVMRMATLAEGGRIVLEDVGHEVVRLEQAWHAHQPEAPVSRVARVLGDRALDIFEAAQLEAALAVIAASRNMAEAGRKLFAVSRTERKSVNDSDRIKKYLQSWNLTYDDVKARLA